MNPNKLIFLCGHRKCGTTLLNNLLDNHNQLSVYPTDLTVLYAFYPQYTENDYSVDEKKARLKKVLFDKFENQNWKETVPEMLDLTRLETLFFENIENDFSIKSILESLFDSYCELIDSNPENYVVGKETSIEIYANELYQMFPGCKFIHIIRDPRDNYASLCSGLENWYSKIGDTRETILHSLIERYGLGLKMIPFNKKSIGINNYKTIRFEDLVTDTEGTLRDICCFLDIRYDKSMLKPTICGIPTGGNSFENRTFANVDNKNVNNWRNRIDDFSAKVIEFHFSDFLTEHNYKLEFSESERASSAADYYKWSNYYYHYKERF